MKQQVLAGFFVKVKGQAAEREAEKRERMLADLAHRKAKKNTPGKVKPSSSADAREGARWLGMASRQDDALNKEGMILILVKGRTGRARKVIMTDQTLHKGGRSQSAALIQDPLLQLCINVETMQFRVYTMGNAGRLNSSRNEKYMKSTCD